MELDGAVTQSSATNLRSSSDLIYDIPPHRTGRDRSLYSPDQTSPYYE